MVAREAELTSPPCMTSLLTGDIRPQMTAAAAMAVCPFKVPDSILASCVYGGGIGPLPGKECKSFYRISCGVPIP